MRRIHQKGFTLVEMLIAAVITVLVAVGATSFISNYVRDGKNLTATMDADQQLGNVLSAVKFHWRHRLAPDSLPAPAPPPNPPAPSAGYFAMPPQIAANPPCQGITMRQRTLAGGTRDVSIFTRCKAGGGIANPGPAAYLRNIGCTPEVVINDNGTVQVFPTGSNALGMVLCFEFPVARVAAIGQVIVGTGKKSSAVASRAYLGAFDRPRDVEYVR